MSFIEVLINNMPSFLAALVLTLQLAVCALIIATIIGTITGIFTVSVHKTLQVISGIYIDLIRGTPLLVQLFVVFYGLPRAGILIDPFPAAVLVFSLNEGAYSAETDSDTDRFGTGERGGVEPGTEPSARDILPDQVESAPAATGPDDGMAGKPRGAPSADDLPGANDTEESAEADENAANDAP